MCPWILNVKQDGRLAPACFSPEYKYFDQHLQTVKNKTTVENLVFEGFLQTSIPPKISIFYAKEGGGGITTFRSKFLSHGTEKFCWGTIQCIRKFRVSKNFFA